MSFTKPTKRFLLPHQTVKVIDVPEKARQSEQLIGSIYSVDSDEGQGVIRFRDPQLGHSKSLVFYSKELKEIGIEELAEGNIVKFTLQKKHNHGKDITIPSEIYRVLETTQECSTEIKDLTSLHALNQGRIFSDDKILVWKNLHFRSPGEIKIAEALERVDVLFLPNCAVRLNTSDNKRETKELDFLICYEGKWGILEVDGKTYHTPERRVEEQERERYFRHHRISTYEHFEHSRCVSEPDNVVQVFLELLRKAHS